MVEVWSNERGCAIEGGGALATARMASEYDLPTMLFSLLATFCTPDEKGRERGLSVGVCTCACTEDSRVSIVLDRTGGEEKTNMIRTPF